MLAEKRGSGRAAGAPGPVADITRALS